MCLLFLRVLFSLLFVFCPFLPFFSSSEIKLVILNVNPSSNLNIVDLCFNQSFSKIAQSHAIMELIEFVLGMLPISYISFSDASCQYKEDLGYNSPPGILLWDRIPLNQSILALMGPLFSVALYQNFTCGA